MEDDVAMEQLVPTPMKVGDLHDATSLNNSKWPQLLLHQAYTGQRNPTWQVFCNVWWLAVVWLAVAWWAAVWLAVNSKVCKNDMLSTLYRAVLAYIGNLS